MKKVLWIFLVTLMLAGLALYSCKDELVQELTGSILGTVADATTGEPVPTVNVSLEPGGKSALTGSDGNYLFSDLEVGSYQVRQRGFSHRAHPGGGDSRPRHPGLR